MRKQFGKTFLLSETNRNRQDQETTSGGARAWSRGKPVPVRRARAQQHVRGHVCVGHRAPPPVSTRHIPNEMSRTCGRVRPASHVTVGGGTTLASVVDVYIHVTAASRGRKGKGGTVGEAPRLNTHGGRFLSLCKLSGAVSGINAHLKGRRQVKQTAI